MTVDGETSRCEKVVSSGSIPSHGDDDSTRREASMQGNVATTATVKPVNVTPNRAWASEDAAFSFAVGSEMEWGSSLHSLASFQMRESTPCSTPTPIHSLCFPFPRDNLAAFTTSRQARTSIW